MRKRYTAFKFQYGLQTLTTQNKFTACVFKKAPHANWNYSKEKNYTEYDPIGRALLSERYQIRES